MYRSAARTKTLCQILRRDRGRSGSLSCRNVGSSAVPSSLTVSTLRASPCRQPFASVLISKFCTSNSEKFIHEGSQKAAYTFEETVSKLEPYHTTMRNSVAVGNVKKIDSTIVEMRLNGLSPTEETYDYLVAAHIVNKDLRAARQTIEDLKDLGISHTTKIMITLMGGYSKVGDFDGTKKVYDEVIHSGFPPDLRLMTELLRAHSVAGNPQLAEEVVADMEALSIIPKAETMHLLMIGYANAKDTKGVQEVLKRFYDKSMKPSTKIMNTVLRSLVSPGVDDWASFMQNYSSLFPGNELEPDFRTYGLLLEACVKDKRVKDAVLIMDEIINLDIKITPESIEIFRSVVGDEIYREIEGKLHKVYTPKINPRTPTEIDKSLEFKKLWGVEPKAETPYSKMRHNPERDKIFAFRRYVGDYYTIIRDYAKDGDVASVKNIMDEMISKKHRCDVEMLNTLLLAHSKNNDCLGAHEVMNEIRRKGMRANISTLRLTISAHAAAGNPDGALSVLKDAIAMNFKPDLYFMTEIIRAYGIVGNVEQAEMTLSALYDLDIKPNKKVMHYVMNAYATVGDTKGLDDVFTRFQAMGLTPISTTFNAVLRCILNNEDMDWEAFTFCYSEHFGFQKLVADIDTYAVLLDGCEKYERPIEAAKYFKQMLATGAYATRAMRDTFRRTLGDLKFDEFRSGLAPEYQRAMSNIDMKAAPFPGRHSFSAEESLRLSRLQATPLTKRMQPKARTLENALKGGNSASKVGQGSASSHLLKSNTQTKDTAPVAVATKNPPSLSALIELGKRGDIPGLEAMIEELKAEGSIPLSMLMENLICAHMKGFDTVSAQRVLDDMKAANIDVSRQSFDYLMEAYSDDGDGPGAELVASQALSMGFALDTSFLNKIIRAYSRSSDPAGAEKAIRAVSASSSDGNKTLIDRKSVNHLLIAYSNTGDAGGAFEVLARYKNTGFIPDTKTVNTLLKAIENSRDPVYVKKLENFASYFWGNDLIADHVTLKIATSLFKKSGEAKAARWLNGMMDQGFTGTNYLFERLAPYIDDKRLDELCRRQGPEEQAARAAAVKVPSRASSPLVAQPRRSWTPRGASSTAEIVPYEVIEVINEAQLVKAKYSALLDKYSEGGNTVSIEGILTEMTIRGIPLNIFHYNHLLRCHAFNKSFSQALKVVKECTDLGLKLTTTSMHHLCEASVRSSNPFNPEQVLLDMQLLGMQPDLYLLDRIMQAHADAGNPAGVEKALSLFPTIEEVPREVTMKHLLRAHAVQGDTAAFNAVMSEVCEANSPIPIEVKNSLLRVLLNAPGDFDWDKFVESYNEHFVLEKVAEDSETFSLLLEGCAKAEKIEQAVEWYNIVITERQKIMTKSIQRAFHKAVGDDGFVKHTRQLRPAVLDFVSEFDKPLETYIPSKRLEVRIKKGGDDASDATAMIKHFKRMETAVQEMAAAGFIEDSEVIAEKSDVTTLSKILMACRTEKNCKKAQIVLSLVRDFRMKPAEKARLNAILTFAKCGDIEGAKRTAAMFQTLGYLLDFKVRNVILSSYVNYPDNTKWEEMIEYYRASFGPNHIRPTFYTIQWLMRAAFKYNKPDAAIQWFHEALDLKLGCEDLKDELKITLGDEKFEEFWSTLDPERQALCAPAESDTVTVDSSEATESLDGASEKSQGVQGLATDLEEGIGADSTESPTSLSPRKRTAAKAAKAVAAAEEADAEVTALKA